MKNICIAGAFVVVSNTAYAMQADIAINPVQSNVERQIVIQQNESTTNLQIVTKDGVSVLSAKNTGQNIVVENPQGIVANVQFTEKSTNTFSLQVDPNSHVNVLMQSDASFSNITAKLTNVVGYNGLPANIQLQQTKLATGSNINLMLNGNGYQSGGVSVVQNSPNAVLNANISGGGSGYTISIRQ